MALWKPFRGNRTALDTVDKHDGFVYFCTDDGSLFFDFVDADGNLQRKQLNAKEAEVLTGFNPVDYQLKNEETLTTTDKTIVGAINEINSIDYDTLLAFDTNELVFN
jgi:hypothetical protein